MVLSPSEGSSHRVTGVKCIAMVSVPSGAAATGTLDSHTTVSTPGTRQRRRRNVLISPRLVRDHRHHPWELVPGSCEADEFGHQPRSIFTECPGARARNEP